MNETENTKGSKDTPETIANGPILFLLVILLMGVLAGMYYWFIVLQSQNSLPVPQSTRPTAEQNNEPESTTAEAQVETLNTVSTSDELNAIESDLESTNLDSMEAEFKSIETELEAAEEPGGALDTRPVTE